MVNFAAWFNSQISGWRGHYRRSNQAPTIFYRSRLLAPVTKSALKSRSSDTSDSAASLLAHFCECFTLQGCPSPIYVNASPMLPIDLNQNELETLRILWERGESKPAEIQAEFSWAIDNGTLRSILVNLVEKQHLARRRDGKAFYYTAQVPKATLLQTMAHSLSRIFAGGSYRELVAQLVETADISPEELKLLRQTAAEGSAQKSKRKQT